MNFIYIDTEFYNSNEKHLTPVCCAVANSKTSKAIWLHEDKEAQSKLRDYFLRNKESVMVSFNVVSEAHFFISIGLDPLEFKWEDLLTEYKMLLNCNNEFLYGEQLKGDEVIFSEPKPRWVKDLETEITGWEDGKELAKKLKAQNKGKYAEGDKNLPAALFKMCNTKIDAEHKDKMRDLILSKGPFSQEDKQAILNYCLEDTKHLLKLRSRIIEEQTPTDTQERRLYRGRISAATAKMTSDGYPVDVEAIKNFQQNIEIALFDLCKSINETTGTELFKWNHRAQKFSKVMSKVSDDIDKRFKDVWPKTATGKYKLDSETLDRMIPTKHSYDPKDVLQQYKRYQNFYVSTNSLRASEKKDSFLDFVGSDNRARSWLNPYGSLSGRFQPKAVSFLFLKGAWIRCLCKPDPGKVIIGMDYVQQEFLLGGCLSLDKEIYNAYQSGDIYVATGKKLGIIKDETEGTEEFKKKRSVAKSAVLGIGYGQQSKSLAIKISEETKTDVTPEMAQEIIDGYYDLYKNYGDYKEMLWITYKDDLQLTLGDGWVLYGDNISKLSVLNCPVQGMGACILRRVILMCYKYGLKPVIPLHDAIYIESDLDKWEEDLWKLNVIMKNAAGFYFKGEAREWAQNIRLSAEIWGPEINPNIVRNEKKNQDQNVPINIRGIQVLKQGLHIDERAEADYEAFKKYFEKFSQEEIDRYKKDTADLTMKHLRTKRKRVKNKNGTQEFLIPIN